jgi:hypothetical protein
MKKLNLEPSEIIRRFLISSAFESNRVIIISPIRHLIALRRVTFYPYTHGEVPWEAVCDLSKFADTAVVTEEAADRNGLLLTYKMAECSMRRYDHRLKLYLSSSLPLILISDTEAVRNNILVSAKEKEYREIVKEAETIIGSSKLVDYGMYLELEFRCRIQCRG